MTATYAQPGFNKAAKENEFELYTAPRGSPDNIGDELRTIHPVIRTNPVTGWKSVFAVGTHVEKVNGLTEEESKHLLDWFVTLIVENHDLQVRFRWQDANDLGKTLSANWYMRRNSADASTAIWDNRSVYHAATPDYEDLGPRAGQRAVSIGEKPYLDPNSTGRREALQKGE